MSNIVDEFLLLFMRRNVTVMIVVATVLVARLLMRRLPKKYSYVLWSVVGIRMIFDLHLPFAYSVSSLLKRGMDHSAAIAEYQKARVSLYLEQGTAASAAKHSSAVTAFANATPTKGDTIWLATPHDILFTVWMIGMVVLLGYGISRYIWLKNQLKQAVKKEQDVWESDRISEPFVFGIIRPRIYIPFRLKKEDLTYILKHERYHIQKKDYGVKLLAYALLCVYWFNPFAWIAYLGLIKDQEMRCDEAVIQELGFAQKKQYSNVLLGFATAHETYACTVLSFGESNVKSRIRNVLNMKKTRRTGKLLAFVMIFFVMIGCLTSISYSKNKETKQQPKKQEQTVKKTEAFCPPAITLTSENGVQYKINAVKYDCYTEDGEKEEPAAVLSTSKNTLELQSEERNSCSVNWQDNVEPDVVEAKIMDKQQREVLEESKNELKEASSFILYKDMSYQITCVYEKEQSAKNGFYGTVTYQFTTK